MKCAAVVTSLALLFFPSFALTQPKPKSKSVKMSPVGTWRLDVARDLSSLGVDSGSMPREEREVLVKEMRTWRIVFKANHSYTDGRHVGKWTMKQSIVTTRPEAMGIASFSFVNANLLKGTMWFKDHDHQTLYWIRVPIR